MAGVEILSPIVAKKFKDDLHFECGEFPPS